MRVLFIGTGEIGVPTLRMLQQSPEHELVGVITQPDKPAGRDQRLRASPIKLLVAETAVPLMQPRRIKSDEAIAGVRALAPDIIVVMAYGQVLPKSVLNAARIACLMPVTVASAAPLTAEHQDQLRSRLRALLQCDVDLAFRTKPTLLAANAIWPSRVPTCRLSLRR